MLTLSQFSLRAELTDSVSAPVTTDSIAPVIKKKIVREKADLENQVNFTSSDSMIVIGRNHTFMYGNSKVTYGDLALTAENIDMDLQTSNVNAIGRTDSLGVMTGTPNFSQGSESYDSESMSYNFKTERGYISNVITQQGEGFLTGGQAKRIENGEFYIKDGRYTTCDDHEHPHFHLQITKGKVKPGSNIVTGPAYMVLAGLPLPIAVPFGYFPFTKKYSSGVIFPTVGDDYRRGFYLNNGGYYFAINDNIDLALTGQIYTKGTWGVNARSSYVKRYKFAGNVAISYLYTVDGEKGSPDYSKATNFQVIWNHQQDSKFNPNMTFSASVNFATSGYSRKDVSSYYSNNFTENTKSSTVNVTYRFPNSKWAASASMNITQRSSDEMLNVSFPNLTVTMTQTAPFKRKRPVGAERWYEKIKLSYSGQFQNSLTAKQDEFFHKSLIKDWKNGMRHSVPISATFQLFKYINITPSLQLTDRMYTQKVRRQWDPNAAAEVTDTTYSFYNVFDFTASVGLSTKVYGFWQPLGIFGKKVKMIRHVLTPTISLSGAPDFGSAFWGYYGSYDYTDEHGETKRKQYSYFPNTAFGVPGTGRQGVLNISLANNLEMKVKTDNDSTGERKISLIENFTIGQSYNFAADSLNWSNLNTSILLRLTKGFNLNLSAVWDVYTYKLNQYGTPYRSNTLRLTSGKGWGRLSSTGTSFSYNFNNDTFKKLFGRRKKNEEQTADNPDDKSKEKNKSKKKGSNAGEFDPDGYLHWSFPWNLSVSYSVNYGYGTFNKKKMEYNGKWTQNLSFSGSINPTPNWNFSFSASYNFDLKKIAYMNCNISRDLHCFTMTASFVPLGPYKSYNFHIAVKSSLLSDLKYDKRSPYSNGIDWY
ncbi:MAG: LPS-assembly protein LptD [Muribaculaceae bacterium]|nr:LPS-assembly protein LptD [Muribaculaceae bacterium]MDE7111704.1 LPS-assembly protein LptD [Muribaculaceae bacterium]